MYLIGDAPAGQGRGVGGGRAAAGGECGAGDGSARAVVTVLWLYVEVRSLDIYHSDLYCIVFQLKGEELL